MNRIIARGATPNTIDFPSPVYSATIMGSCEDVVLGVGGGRRYGMPNAMVCVQITSSPVPAKEANATGASDREKKKMAEYVPPEDGSICWDLDSYLDLGDDQPWSSSNTFIASLPGVVSNSSITSSLGNQNNTYVAIGHLSAFSVIQHVSPQGSMSSSASSPNTSFSRSSGGGAKASPAATNEAAHTSVIARVARKSLTENPNDPDKKCVCVVHTNGAPITDAVIFAGQDDGSLSVSVLVEKGSPTGGDKAATMLFDTKSVVIPAAELAMRSEAVPGAGEDKNAHISTLASQTALDKDGNKSLIIMMVCDDKKVRYVLLPSPAEVNRLVSAHGSLEVWKNDARVADVGEDGKPIAVAVAASSKAPTFNVATSATCSSLLQHVLVASAADLSLSFTITRSSLRLGSLFEGRGASCNTVTGGSVVSCLVAYDSDAKTSVMSLSVVEVVGGARPALRLVPLFEGKTTNPKAPPTAKPPTGAVVYGATAVTFPVCSGAATNISPVYPKLLSPSRTILPPEFLVSTVEGELVLLSAVFSTPADGKPSSFLQSAALPPVAFPIAATSPSKGAPSTPYLIATGTTAITPLRYQPTHVCPALSIRKKNSEKGWLHTEPISTMDLSSQSGLVVTADIAQKAKLTLLDGGRSALEENRSFLSSGSKNGGTARPATLLIPPLFPPQPSSSTAGLVQSATFMLLVVLMIVAAQLLGLVDWAQ